MCKCTGAGGSGAGRARARVTEFAGEKPNSLWTLFAAKPEMQLHLKPH